jgi:hypothetical protein
MLQTLLRLMSALQAEIILLLDPASAADVVYRDFDVFVAEKVFVDPIL